MKTNKKLFHLTPIENANSIRTEGIRANKEGEIYLFEDKTLIMPEYLQPFYGKTLSVADHIAKNQVFIQRYALFEIRHKGIESDLIPDICGELTKDYQWIVKQSLIEKKYITLLGFYEVGRGNTFPIAEGILDWLNSQNENRATS